MKAPAKDDVQRILLRKRANDRIDAAVSTGKRHKAEPFEIHLLDKVMRPFSLSLIEERYRDGADANDVRDAVCNLVANMLVEMLQQIAEKDDPEGAVIEANTMLKIMTEHFNTAFGVNYGLTTTPVRD